MREIDLLPGWYKRNKLRRMVHRVEYIALVVVLAGLLCYSFISGSSVSKASAEVAEMELGCSQYRESSAEYVRVKGEISLLEGRLKLIEQLGGKIDMDAVLAEVSFLTNEGIVLSEISCVGEVYEGGAAEDQKKGSGVKLRGVEQDEKKAWFNDTRYRFVISGLASESGKVADLICRMEDSAYFCQVSPSYSRNKVSEIKDKSGKKLEFSEFQISCYLANYVEVESAGESR